MNPLIQCIGFDASSLTQEQASKLNAWVSGHKAGDLIALHAYPNVDTSAENGNPSGVVAYYRPEARVDAGALSDSLFERVSVAPIKGTYNDEYFETKINALAEAVPQSVEDAINGKIRNITDNSDADHWSSDMGGTNSMIGVYSELAEDMRTKSYHLVARGTVPAYVADFKRAVATLKPTYGDLVTKSEWIDRMGYGVNAAARNVHRNMAAVAEAIGVSLFRSDDHHAFTKDDGTHVPEMAVPEWTQTTHTIQAGSIGNKPMILVAHGVITAAHAISNLGEKIFIVGSPFDGIYAFPISRVDQLLASGGLPVDTGRYVAKKDIPEGATQLYESRSKGIVWEGPSKINADLHPAAYRPVNAAFKSSMKQLGWNPEDHEGRLVPVAVKISSV